MTGDSTRSGRRGLTGGKRVSRRAASLIGITGLTAGAVLGGIAAAPQALAGTVAGISPADGATAGGYEMTITGTGFGTTPGTVTIGGNAAGFVTWSDTEVDVVVPPGEPGTVPVVVTDSTGDVSNALSFTYDAPLISGLSPSAVSTAGGTPVALTGTNFGTPPGTVSIGNDTATIVSWSDNAIVISTPAEAAGSATLTVTAGGETSNAEFLTYQTPLASSSAGSPPRPATRAAGARR